MYVDDFAHTASSAQELQAIIDILCQYMPLKLMVIPHQLSQVNSPCVRLQPPTYIPPPGQSRDRKWKQSENIFTWESLGLQHPPQFYQRNISPHQSWLICFLCSKPGRNKIWLPSPHHIYSSISLPKMQYGESSGTCPTQNWKCSREPTEKFLGPCLYRQVLQCRLLESHTKSWIPLLESEINDLNLPNITMLFQNTPSNSCWKRCIKNILATHAHLHLLNQQERPGIPHIV